MRLRKLVPARAAGPPACLDLRGSSRCSRGQHPAPGRVLAATAAAALAAATALGAQTVALGASADTTLKQANPNQSFGRQATLVVREGASRVLVQFDSAAIAAAVGSASFASAQLQVYVTANAANWGTTGRTVDLYRVATPWTEAGATWSCASDPDPGHGGAGCPVPWSGGTPPTGVNSANSANGANGIDGDGEPTDTVVITNATAGWVQFDVTADVAAFLAGTANNGWLLQKTDEAQAGRIDLASREGTPGLGPRLILVSQSPAYDTVPPTLTITAPAQPVLVNVPSPAIGLAYQDPGSGVDTSTLHVLLDGQDLTAGCTAGSQAASCTPSAPLAAGTHTVSASLADHAGNVATATGSFQLFLGPSVATVTLPVSGDTYISAKSPDREHGRAAFLRVAKAGPSRALVAFDPGALLAALAGDQLLAAQLQLGIAANARNWGAAGRTVGAYRLTTPWSEASATWDCPADTNLDNDLPDCPAPAGGWNGGAFVSTPTATALVTRQLAGSVSFDVTADVASFLSGTANSGWLIGKTDETLAGRIDLTAREAASGQPAQLVVVFQVPPQLPTVTISSPADGSYTNHPTVVVSGQAGGSATGVAVDGQPAALGPGGAFSLQVTLAPGFNAVTAVASDAGGDQATATVGVTLDTTPPTVTLTSPAPGAITNQPQVTVAGTALDDQGVASLTVAGQPVTLAGNQFSAIVQLAAGVNQIPVVATDLAGNTRTATATVTQFTVPVVAISSPADLSYVNATTVTVSGTVTAGGAGGGGGGAGGGSAGGGSAISAVTVNGVAAALTGTGFTATGVPLVEGGNTLTATATDGQGHVGTASINVVRDLTPPHVAIYTPSAGATLTGSSVAVSGLVNDIVAGTVNAANATVTVNGIPATVGNRSFLVPSVPLQPGTNVLTAVATDAAGNQAQVSITVHQVAPAGRRIAVVSGSGQSAPIGTPLPLPLVAVLLDATGQPVAGQQVLFQALGTDGTFDNGRRTYAVTSDVSGQAAVHFTVGSHAGAGNQLVQATSAGAAGPAQFLASAQPGPPALLVVDAGDQQQGVAGQALPLPLVAVVVDAGGNRLPGIAATFRVVKGAGVFANGQPTLSLTSDGDGRLIASFTTDPAEGVANNVVEATIDAPPGGSGGPVVSFTASALAAYDPALTAISGVVLDNSNQPVPGATLRLRGTALTTQTDAQGLFHLAAVPAGTLQLIVDGSTVERPGSWPQLELNLTPVPGRNNVLRMPIYLLPLDVANGVAVDETHGGTLTLAQLPGFSLKILPGSVTFPGGSRSGTVSVTVVHSDKVPMVPNFGQQPRLIVTIQPAGAQFNPPATITLPNVEGFAAGRTAEIYSFDHDLGHFVSIGPGTVSDDGTVITSNVGVGIVKAGWHCCGFPQGTGAPNSCPDCTTCTGSQCAPNPICTPCKTTPGDFCDGGGDCIPPDFLIPDLTGQDLLILPLGPEIPMQHGDLPKLPTCFDASTSPCFAAYKQTLGPLTLRSPCSGVDLTGATLLETISPISTTDSSNCPMGGDTGPGCRVISGNRLVSSLDPTQPCADVLASCGLVPPHPCTDSVLQTYKLNDVVIFTRIITTTISPSGSGCTVKLTTSP